MVGLRNGVHEPVKHLVCPSDSSAVRVFSPAGGSENDTPQFPFRPLGSAVPMHAAAHLPLSATPARWDIRVLPPRPAALAPAAGEKFLEDAGRTRYAR